MRERDRELERVLSAHAAALARLAASYESRPALREELLQEITFALWRALPAFRHEASERTFVLRIATNRALSHLAARIGEIGDASLFPREGNRDASPILEVADAGPRPDEEAANMQDAERLQRAVRALPLPLCQVMVLALEGLDHEDISRVLGISPGNVAVRLHRSKAKLKTALGEPS